MKANTLVKLADDKAQMNTGTIVGFILAVVVFGALIGTALDQLDRARDNDNNASTASNASNLGVAGLFGIVAVIAIVVFIAMLAKHAE